MIIFKHLIPLSIIGGICLILTSGLKDEKHLAAFKSDSCPRLCTNLQLEKQQQIFPPKTQQAVHSPSITQLDENTLFCVWYSGSREGARDVVIQASLYNLNLQKWEDVRVLITPEQVEHDLGHSIRKLGNPVVIANQKGGVWLFFVSTSLAGWSTGQINIMISKDFGKTWGKIKQLTTSPIFNMGMMVRSSAILNDDGTISLPIYAEMGVKFGAMMRVTQDGDVIALSRIPSTTGTCLQPSVAVKDQHNAFAFMRDGGNTHKIFLSSTSDAGQTWTPATPISIPNKDSSVASISLDSTTIMLIHNTNQLDVRNELVFSLSRDSGKSWQTIDRLAMESESEVSYPNIVKDSNGVIHVVYTWKRQGIKHAVFKSCCHKKHDD